jgi:transposase
MPGLSATTIHLAPPVRAVLEEVVRRGTSAQRDVERASIVLEAAAGLSNAEIGRRLGVTDKTVRKWRNRFAAHSVRAALDDAKRSGRPASIPLEARCELIKIACDRPPGIALRDVWTHTSLSENLIYYFARTARGAQIFRGLRRCCGATA